MKIFFTTRFRRSYKRLVSKNAILKNLAEEKFLIFERNPQDITLGDHALKGQFTGYRVFSIGYDLRVIYRREKEICVFFDIGTHKQIYKID